MNILGHEYEVVDVEPTLGSTNLVSLSWEKGLIYLDKDQTATMKQSAVLHEIIEALNLHFDFNLQHHVIASLEAGLFQVLTTNGVSLQPLLKGLNND